MSVYDRLSNHRMYLQAKDQVIDEALRAKLEQERKQQEELEQQELAKQQQLVSFFSTTLS